MGETSVLSDAEDGLLAAIQTRAAIPGNPLEGIALQLGDPGLGAEPEQIWIADEASTEQTFDLTNVTGGGERRWEVASLTVVIELVISDEYKTVRDRGMALAAEVEKAIRGDRQLGGKVFDAEVRGLGRMSGKSDKARIMWFTVRVQARAFLS